MAYREYSLLGGGSSTHQIKGIRAEMLGVRNRNDISRKQEL